MTVTYGHTTKYARSLGLALSLHIALGTRSLETGRKSPPILSSLYITLSWLNSETEQGDSEPACLAQGRHT